MVKSAEERIRITQENPDAPVELKIGANRFVPPEPLDEATRQRVRKIGDFLRAWTETAPAAESRPEEEVNAPALRGAPHALAVSPAQVATLALAQEFTEPFWRRLLDAILMRDEQLPVRPSLDNELLRATGDFVGELEGILHERLARRAEPLEHEIRFVAGVKGRLQILIADQAYESVADIPEGEERTLIQEAIAEWEGRH